jgi:hypothetical protein
MWFDFKKFKNTIYADKQVGYYQIYEKKSKKSREVQKE